MQTLPFLPNTPKLPQTCPPSYLDKSTLCTLFPPVPVRRGRSGLATEDRGLPSTFLIFGCPNLLPTIWRHTAYLWFGCCGNHLLVIDLIIVVDIDTYMQGISVDNAWLLLVVRRPMTCEEGQLGCHIMHSLCWQNPMDSRARAQMKWAYELISWNRRIKDNFRIMAYLAIM